ncbi:MAG: hypothetical protein JRH15_15355, partial [Deltaproteobacteria bacterium]|nr:hypothetical protein [Deltaproteobacteria bacterium]
MSEDSSIAFRSPLIETKIRPPRYSGSLVPRPRLLEFLTQGKLRKLTIVQAPAGFGKTALLLELHKVLKIKGFDVAWFSIDDDDNNFGQFFSYILAALQVVFPGKLSGAPALLQAGPTIPHKAIISILINELAAIEIETPTFLIIDDYQYISDQTVNAGLKNIVKYLPTHMHLVVAGRSVPPLNIATLRAYKQLHEINAEQLRFTFDEANYFLNDINRLDLNSIEMDKLLGLTEGWITGLQLASISLRRLRDRLAFIESFSGRFDSISDYLTEDVLRKLPEKVVDFLLKTSILNRIHPDLCNAVVGTKNGIEILNYLKINNIFISQLGETESWYRYHQLFAHYLEAHLKQVMPDIVKSLHRKACDWFSTNGFPAEAVKHAIAAADPQRAAELIESCAMAIGRGGQFSLLYSWAQNLPKEFRDSCRNFKLTLSWILAVSGRWKEAEGELESLERILTPDQRDEDKAIADEIKVVHVATAVVREDYIMAERLSSQWIASSATSNPRLMPDICNCLAFAQLSLGNFAKARDVLMQAIEFQETHYTFTATFYRKIFFAMIDAAEGNLQEAARKYRDILGSVKKEAGQSSILADVPAVLLYNILYEWNEIESAVQLIGLSLDLVDFGYFPNITVDFYIPHSFMLVRSRGLDEALALLDRLEEYAHRKENQRLVAAFENQKVRILLSQNKVHQAFRLVEKNRENVRRQEKHYIGDPMLTRELEKNTDARLM